ncbi:tRNA wybutosine-synthesizing protein 3 [Tolypocladium ophioglossoides CBS 100239]|uniref:tRNA(Phe) 7-[(3-amino-3-carboxypropyl)-4-demethylwyosine(37)-N(4)]-methyltransferase n=1 Tax=Tolypocladium ophioglossoides (strain CBS 100239) TaxID=1163406 RepID=A0A0L0N787_TOLOC|nr:tRNA wybutosine-synthesizing protein 3 [Tolypocladium ophioglossoides CBS 100239]
MQQSGRLPAPSGSFGEKKVKILQQLDVPEAEYADASPKGSVDEGIRDLIGEVNRAEGFVTTSSCAGRVSVFLEGRKTAAGAGVGEGDEHQQREQVAGVGGKGAGGTWLYVSHEPVACDGEDDYEAWASTLGFAASAVSQSRPRGSAERRLIHFKFEPMILHVLTTSLTHAQLLLRCALQAGFRESGAINLTSPSETQPSTAPIVAVRSMGLGFESLVGYETPDGQRRRLVPVGYLQTLLSIGNERFAENAKRIARFRAAFQHAVREPEPRRNPDGGEWEDALARRERMRAEGLRRKSALEAERNEERCETAGQP